MNLNEFKNEFELDLENGLDHAEYYETEIRWLIEQAEKYQRIKDKIIEQTFQNNQDVLKKLAES